MSAPSISYEVWVMNEGNSSDLKNKVNWAQFAYEIFIKKSGIHFFYIIAILVVLLVIMLAYNFSENKELVAYISFAATISSLILATFAIFYAVHSNSNISSLSNELKVSSNIIMESSNGIRISSDELKAVTADIASVVVNLSNKMDVVPQAINDGFENMKNNNQIYAGEPQELETLNSNQLTIGINDLPSFINGLAPQPKVLLLFVKLSELNGIIIRTNEFDKLFQNDSAGLLAFCSIFNTLKLIDFYINIDKPTDRTVITITRINEECGDLIFSAIEFILIEEMKNTDYKSRYTYQTIVKCFKYFDKYFIPESCPVTMKVINES
ncbi:hypothetical protein [Shewanella hafniensis]|uniref:hypothetical protein n=1 Tax=Shewanella hafniensis TaxID=365590 RepID=UPI00200CAE8A|nr:hypothetical protein [Shewanella hafniensis]MCL1135642.1 hypothetical protein [Shewanella hafniensis]